jgi:hypothetical protein
MVSTPAQPQKSGARLGLCRYRAASVAGEKRVRGRLEIRAVVSTLWPRLWHGQPFRRRPNAFCSSPSLSSSFYRIFRFFFFGRIILDSRLLVLVLAHPIPCFFFFVFCLLVLLEDSSFCWLFFSTFFWLVYSAKDRRRRLLLGISMTSRRRRRDAPLLGYLGGGEGSHGVVSSRYVAILSCLEKLIRVFDWIIIQNTARPTQF